MSWPAAADVEQRAGTIPIIVVVPPASACSDCSGDPRWAWDSIAPAVTIKPAPETGEVVGRRSCPDVRRA